MVVDFIFFNISKFREKYLNSRMVSPPGTFTLPFSFMITVFNKTTKYGQISKVVSRILYVLNDLYPKS